MSRAQLDPVVRHIHQLASPAPDHEPADELLVRRFAASRDEAAFEDLIRRHGRLVWNVCRHLLPREQDAEDAFQATFFVLAQKAGSIRKGGSVASWLYGVAFRTAKKAQAMIAKRRELPASSRSSVQPASTEAALRELQAILDEEVSRLPETLRSPFVLCCLQGKTKPEVARELGWKEGTVSGRLARARRLLQERLARRGAALSAALCAGAVGAESASAAVPEVLCRETVGATFRFLAGGSGKTSSAVTLAQAVVQSLAAARAKTVLILMACLGIAAAGLMAYGGRQPPPAEIQAEPGQAGNKPGDHTKPAKSPAADRFGDPLPAGAIARLGTVRFRHGDQIGAVAISPDGRFLASGGGDDSLSVWDATTGRELHRFTGQGDYMMAVAFAKKGNLLAARGTQKVYLLDWPNGTKLRSVAAPVNGTVNASPLAISPEGKTIAVSGQDHAVYLLDAETGRETHRLEGHRDMVPCLAFTPDGEHLVSGSTDQSVRVWSVATGKKEKNFKAVAAVWFVAVSRDGKTIAATGFAPKAQRWELSTGKELPGILGLGFGCISFTPDGNLLGGQGLWDVKTAKLVRKFPEYLSGHRLSEDGKFLVCWNHYSFRLFDVETAKERKAFPGHEGEPMSLAFSPDGRRLVSGAWREPAVREWDPATGEDKGRWLGKPVPGFLGMGGEDYEGQNGASAVAFSPDGKILAAGHGITRSTLHLWDAVAGKEIRGFSTKHKMIMALAFSPDGKTLASADYDKRVSLWDISAGTELRAFEGPAGQTKALAFSPDGKTLACAGGGVTGPTYGVSVWDVSTGKELSRFEKNDGPIACARFSPEARTLAVGGFNKTALLLWDVPTGKEVGRVDHQPWHQSLAFAPDGRSLAIAVARNEVQIWELASGKVRARYPGHRGMVNALVFSPDGNRLASASRDTSILVWDLVGKPVGDGASANELPRAWDSLAEPDPAKAYPAMAVFLRHPTDSAKFLADHLHPTPALPEKDRETVQRLITKLDSGDFEERESAMKELEKLGNQAEAVLREAVAKEPSAEVQRRLEQLLGQLDPGQSPDWLRTLRALEVLERTGTADARALLKELAVGSPSARLTEAAKVSIARLSARAQLVP